MFYKSCRDIDQRGDFEPIRDRAISNFEELNAYGITSGTVTGFWFTKKYTKTYVINVENSQRW